MESSKLLTRLEELSQVNGGLEDQIGKQKQKNYKLQREIEDLREKIKMLKSSNVGDSLAGYDLESHPMDMSYFKNTQDVKLRLNGMHVRNDSKTSVVSVVSTNSEIQPTPDNKHEESLSHEIYMNTSVLNQNNSNLPNNFHLNLQTKNSYNDEEMFDSQNSYRSQYRFETTEDDLVNNSDEGRENNSYEKEIDPE